MSYLNELKQKIAGKNARAEPAKPAEEPFAGSAGLSHALVAGNFLPVELLRCIEYVAAFHGFTLDELQEATEIAAGDVENALTCFRALASEIRSPASSSENTALYNRSPNR